MPAFAVDGTGRDNPDMGTALFAGAVLTQELMYIGHTIINVTVPAAIAALRGAEAEAAAKEAERGAYLTRAIPGGANRAGEVIAVAKRIHERLIEAPGA